MRWSRIKNIIILMLVIVNLFLLAMVGLRAWRSRRDDRENRARMVFILQENGIDFLPGEVPGAWTQPPGEAAPTDPGREVMTASTALVRFLEALKQEGYLCTQVTGMHPAVRTDEEGNTIPVWIIGTDAWPWRFSVDGYTGALTTSE